LVPTGVWRRTEKLEQGAVRELVVDRVHDAPRKVPASLGGTSPPPAKAARLYIAPTGEDRSTVHRPHRRRPHVPFPLVLLPRARDWTAPGQIRESSQLWRMRSFRELAADVGFKRN
jgi:hypothetical protein